MATYISRIGPLVIFLALLILGGVVSENNTRQTTRTGRRWRLSRPRAAVSSHSRPLHRLYLPFLVSETIVLGNENHRSEANIEFCPNLHQLENITRAFLNITTSQNLSSSGDDWTWSLIGVSTSTCSGNTTTTISPIGTSFPSNTRSFNVLHYLRNLMEVSVRQSNGTIRIHVIKIVFKVRRSCSPPFCQPFLDTALRLPFLKVDYTPDIEASGDADVQGLFNVVG